MSSVSRKIALVVTGAAICLGAGSVAASADTTGGSTPPVENAGHVQAPEGSPGDTVEVAPGDSPEMVPGKLVEGGPGDTVEMAPGDTVEMVPGKPAPAE